MATFSERYGYEPVRAALGQYESMDTGLRTAIWNVLWQQGYITFVPDILHGPMGQPASPDNFAIFRREALIYDIRKWYFHIEWYQVYNFVEFCIANSHERATRHLILADRMPTAIRNEIDTINKVLAREGSAYRLVDLSIVPLSNEHEIAEVESAASLNPHIKKAIELLSNRIDPDVENIIKESISAVEYAVRQTTGGRPLTMGLEKIAIHPQLAQAWKNMYQWTSDEPGVRHGKPPGSKVDMDLARYTFVTASAFVNYLKSRSM